MLLPHLLALRHVDCHSSDVVVVDCVWDRDSLVPTLASSCPNKKLRRMHQGETRGPLDAAGSRGCKVMVASCKVMVASAGLLVNWTLRRRDRESAMVPSVYMSN